jgi:type IV secretory pathway protease TraF
MKLFIVRYRRVFAVVFILAAASFVTSRFYTFHINVTKSLPHKLFIVDKTDKALSRDALYAFRWTGGYGYDSGSVFIKKAGALSGDRITVVDRVVHVNDAPLVVALERTPKGTPLIPTIAQTVPLNGVLFYTNSREGFDGRYDVFGLTHTKTLIGRAYGFF